MKSQSTLCIASFARLESKNYDFTIPLIGKSFFNNCDLHSTLVAMNIDTQKTLIVEVDVIG